MPYLDHAATSLPKPPQVIEAICRALESCGNPGRGGHRHASHAEQIIECARNDVRRLIGADDARRIVFALNGTDALNIAIHATIEAASADGAVPHVVTTVLEHNSITRPLHALLAAGRIVLEVVDAPECGILDPQRLVDAVRGDTALVAFTMASNALGTLQPVRIIAEAVHSRSDALVLMDAAQTVGAVPIDVGSLGADLLAAPGHKALLGPMGTGVLWVGPRAMPDLDGRDSRLAVFRSGGTGGDSRLVTMPPELPHRLEGGTPNVVGIAGLGAGARWVRDRGVETIRRHEMALIDRVIAGLMEIPAVRIVGPPDSACRTGAVSFTIAGQDPLDVAAVLDASFGVAMRAGLHCAPGAHRAAGTAPAGTVRLSVGATTTMEEVEQALRAIEAVAGGGEGLGCR